MSEEKLSEELQEEPEVAIEVDDASETPEPTAEEPERAGEEARDLIKELSEAQEEVASLRDRLLRLAADTENFKKRVERERLASLKYAGESIFREILPVVDNLERAVEQGNPEGGDTEKSVQALHEGVQLTLKSLVNILEKFEVKPIESTGKPFDPQHQDAMTMEESDTVPTNHVLREFQKGYYYKDRLLRAAKVVVSSGKTDTKS